MLDTVFKCMILFWFMKFPELSTIKSVTGLRNYLFCTDVRKGGGYTILFIWVCGWVHGKTKRLVHNAN